MTELILLSLELELAHYGSDALPCWDDISAEVINVYKYSFCPRTMFSWNHIHWLITSLPHCSITSIMLIGITCVLFFCGFYRYYCLDFSSNYTLIWTLQLCYHVFSIIMKTECIRVMSIHSTLKYSSTNSVWLKYSAIFINIHIWRLHVWQEFCFDSF